MRKLLLSAHVVLSVGWVGALAVFMAHALACLVSSDEFVVRASALAMGITAWLVILPLSIGTLLTGLVQASASAWGLLRHYWVLFKLVLTALATVVLLLKLPSIAMLAETARGPDFDLAGTRGPRTSIALHAAGGLLVLLLIAGLAVYKPSGLVGRRLPGWAKVMAAVAAGLLLAVALMVIFGGHGPSRA